MQTSYQIAQQAKPLPISSVARKLGIRSDELHLFGNFIAKIDLKILDRIKKRKRGKYILVTAITPTPLGEGKTTTTIGLSMALNRLGKRASACIRQPSLGPVFGIKGGAAGAGYSQVMPAEELNLHFTGDMHAVGLAHNLCAAFLYNSIFKGNSLHIDQNKIYWRRVLDVSDRFLRTIKTEANGFSLDSGFDSTAASEIMAILALSKDLKDLRRRLALMCVAESMQGKPVSAHDIKVDGALAVLLKDALKPNLIQTLENTPCFVHTGPFGNIAHGSSSILADEIALHLSDYVVTESGFGADLGAEKFFNIKCRASGLEPACAVLVVSIRALKAHSGRFTVVAGQPLDARLREENMSALEEGLCNLKKQIENVRIFGVPVVVAINKFSSDTQAEIGLVTQKAVAFGAAACCVSEVWERGSKGGLDLAKAVIQAASQKNAFQYLYPLEAPIKDKINAIAMKIYGAKCVEYSPEAEVKIQKFNEHGWCGLPVCMAKTHLSLSHDPHVKGVPQDFVLPVRDIRASVGAGFLYPLCGSMQTMPGLPAHPRGEAIDIDEKGNITGLL